MTGSTARRGSSGPESHMNQVTPEVSVIVAAYNAEATLGEQLEALSRQAVSFPWELLVCDNGSTDGTAELVRSLVDH